MLYVLRVPQVFAVVEAKKVSLLVKTFDLYDYKIWLEKMWVLHGGGLVNV